MIGKNERSFAPFTDVSMEELVPQDHFYRHLEKTLDLSFARELVQETYAWKGRTSIKSYNYRRVRMIFSLDIGRRESVGLTSLEA
jgi:hypothetical protein